MSVSAISSTSVRRCGSAAGQSVVVGRRSTRPEQSWKSLAAQVERGYYRFWAKRNMKPPRNPWHGRAGDDEG